MQEASPTPQGGNHHPEGRNHILSMCLPMKHNPRRGDPRKPRLWFNDIQGRKRGSRSLVIGEMQINTTVRYHFTPSRTARIRKKISVGEEVGKWEPSYNDWGECIRVRPHWETVWQSTKKLDTKLPDDPEKRGGVSWDSGKRGLGSDYLMDYSVSFWADETILKLYRGDPCTALWMY